MCITWMVGSWNWIGQSESSSRKWLKRVNHTLIKTSNELWIMCICGISPCTLLGNPSTLIIRPIIILKFAYRYSIWLWSPLSGRDYEKTEDTTRHNLLILVVQALPLKSQTGLIMYRQMIAYRFKAYLIKRLKYKVMV